MPPASSRSPDAPDGARRAGRRSSRSRPRSGLGSSAHHAVPYAPCRWPRASTRCSRRPGARSGSPTRARSTSRARAGRSSTSRVLPDARRGRARPPARAPDGDEALRQRDHGGADLAEARAAERARLAADRDRRLPVRAHGRGARRQRRRAPRVGGQPRRDRLQPVAGAARRPRPPGRAARRPRPDARRSAGTRCAARRWSCATCSPSTGCAATRRRRARRASTSTSASSRAWDFLEVRRAALALAREVERRAPDLATSKWWKEERHGVFVDYNQNARDRTVASCYSVRPTPDARVSCALRWDEVPDVEPGDLRLDTVPERLRDVGDPAADIDEQPGSLDAAARPRAPRRGGRARRRAVAAALPQAAGRAQARPAEPRPRPPDAARPRRRPAARRPAARRAHRRAPARLRLQAPDRPGPRARVRRLSHRRAARRSRRRVAGGRPGAHNLYQFDRQTRYLPDFECCRGRGGAAAGCATRGAGARGAARDRRPRAAGRTRGARPGGFPPFSIIFVGNIEKGSAGLRDRPVCGDAIFALRSRGAFSSAARAAGGPGATIAAPPRIRETAP